MKTETSNEQIKRRREAHHRALVTLARQVGFEPVSGLDLWRQLRKLENTIYKVCLDYTNGENGVGIKKWEETKQQSRRQLCKIFGGKIPSGVFINGDPRGHMLKLDSETVVVPEGMQTDWGQDGILAAEINEEET